ncbi:hypothetical protein POM88_008891 [Heracleum sosnowskyi]|uniref:Superoxide dismutase n=1 Tax=Heracleum sosnowskyi TaxID=360622 RepID=A0AAD8J9L5_9APIA|nr:hypothetical protein POM88_008891 [Heracleum sosnowskyi]
MWDDVNSRSISYGVNRKSEKDPRLMDDYERMLDASISKSDSNAIAKLHTAFRFNGGGHINHSIFWRNLSPIQEGGGEPPKGSFGGAIDAQFGSLEALVQKMNREGTALQGSGWVACLIIRNLVFVMPVAGYLILKSVFFFLFFLYHNSGLVWTKN